MKCSASVDTARYRPRRRRLGRPKTRPISAPTAPSRQRHPERRAELLEQDAGGEGAGGEQPGVAERDLAGVAGEQHQRHRADRRRAAPGWRGRAANARRRRTARRTAPRPKHGEPALLRARVEQRKVAARSSCGSSRSRAATLIRGRALPACRTGPTAARPASPAARGTAPRRRAAGRRSGSAAPRPPATMSEPSERAEQAVEAADQRGRERLQADDDHASGRAPSRRRSACRPAAGEGGQPPGERVDAVQADAALRREQRVLAGRAHADAPARAAQEHEQAAIDAARASTSARPTARDARRRPTAIEALVQPSCCSGCCSCVPTHEHHRAAQQDAERDGREHRGEHRSRRSCAASAAT